MYQQYLIILVSLLPYYFLDGAQHVPVPRYQVQYCLTHLTRPLGRLERYLYDWNILCNDTHLIQLSMTRKLPITQQHITDAVSGVLQQHPLLRTTLLKTGNVISMVESTHSSLPLEFMKIRDFRCEFNSCPLENEMCRIFALNPSDEESLEFTFMLALHPVAADFVYTRQIIRNIINNIHFAQIGKYRSSNMVSILSDPIEKMTEHVPINRASSYVDLVRSSNKHVIMAHDVFVLSKIRRGRLNLSSNPSKRLVWKLNKNLSKVIDTSFK